VEKLVNKEEQGSGAPDLSVVIVNWNTCGDLRECLSSIRDEGAEVIVVDNASADGSRHMVEEEFPQARLIANTRNLGFATASNLGIEASHGRYVLLLNPDSEVRKGAFKALIDFGDRNPRIGIFGPKILNPDGSIQYSCRRFPNLKAGLFRNTILGRLFPKNAYIRDYLMTGWDHNEPRDVDWVSGAALVIRREAIDDVGLLDERFFMYCEDVDLAFRAGQKGWRVAYFPEAVVVHARAKSSDKAVYRMVIEFHRSMYRFFEKHYKRDASIPMRIIVPLGLIVRACFFLIHGMLTNAVRTIRGGKHIIADEQEGCHEG
jgi:GT2 family glycosyltransferase